MSTAKDTTSVTTTSEQRRSRVNHVGARLLRYRKMARNATEEQKPAQLKDKVQTVKKSLEEQQHRNNRRCSKQFNSTRPLKKPGRLQRRKP